MIQRVKLPSGRVIEVVTPDDELPIAKPPAPPLHVCTTCRSDKVYPVTWGEAGHLRWSIDLRCPECLTERTTMTTNAEAESFDEVLENGHDILVRDLRRLTTANMTEELWRFVYALEHDAIVASDFGEQPA